MAYMETNSFAEIMCEWGLNKHVCLLVLKKALTVHNRSTLFVLIK